MKLRRVLVPFLIILLMLPCLLMVCGFCLPAQYGNTFVAALGDKMEHLRSAPLRRLILVGGSGTAFGVRSDLVEAHFPQYSVVNMGLYVQLGIPVLLDLLEEELRQDDVVLICPEQNSQAMSDQWDPEILWQAVDGQFSLLSGLSVDRWERMTAAFASFAGKKCAYAVKGAPQPADIYARSSFNVWGDIDSPLRSANSMAGGYDPNQRIFLDGAVLSDEFADILNQFNRIAQEKGAQVYYRFPPMNRAALADPGEMADSFYDRVCDVLDFPVLGDPGRSILDSGWFYDTNFHLNSSGAIVYTKYLVEDLKALWKDTTPTRIELPAMPAPEDAENFRGDDSCADCFTYSENGDGWTVSGLTDKGIRAQTLILPTWYQGKPVLAVDQDLLAGHTRLRRITIQPNIGILYDGMFRGCTALEELVLTGAPSDHTAGDGLRDGAAFVICVPREHLDQYRRHYSWQYYSQYLTVQS